MCYVGAENDPEGSSVAYMSREKRHEQIVNAVIDITSREGLAAATVRRVAQELEISPGQIHHHFSSADALRAEALRAQWRKIEPELTADLQRLPPRQRLLALLDSVALDEDLQPSAARTLAEQLWRDAIWAIRMDVSVREAVVEGIRYWQNTLRDTLEQGIVAGDFPKTLHVENALITLQSAVFGFDSLTHIDPDGHTLSKTDFVLALVERHIMSTREP